MNWKLFLLAMLVMKSLALFGQNEKQIYFADSLFCLVEFNQKDTLWHIVKDGTVRDSVESWSFGTVSKSKDSIYLNCFLTFNRKDKENKCDESLWTQKISREKYIKNTRLANSQEELDLLPELTTRFATNYYWFINFKNRNSTNANENNEVVKSYYCYEQFIANFPNDSLQFIKTFINHFNTPKDILFDEAIKNYEKGNFAKAQLYVTAFQLAYYETYKKEKFESNDEYIIDIVDELSNVALLGEEGNEFAYFNPYNYVLLEKFEGSKALFPKTKRYGKVWWDDSLKVGDIIKCPTISHRIGGGGGLNENSKDSVKIIADVIKNNPRFIFEISYHTDHRGASHSNLTLSDRHANFLRDYLIYEHKVDSDRIKAKGYGESKPIIPVDEIDHTDDQYEKEKLFAVNRRYELKVDDRITKDLNEIPSDGKYLFDAAFAEWQGKSMGVKVNVITKGDSIRVVYAGGGDLTARIGEVLDEGIIMKHKTGVWIIGSGQDDKLLDEVGGCTGGPAIIDFENKRYWMC